MDLLNQIDNLQAYLQEMKEKIKKGEISESDSQKELLNIDVFKKKKPEKPVSPKKKKPATRLSASASYADSGAAGDTNQYQSIEEVEKEMEKRVENMKRLLNASGTKKTQKHKKSGQSLRNFIKVVQMRRSEKFQCTECKRTFVHINKAEEHVKDEHLDENDEAIVENYEDVVPAESEAINNEDQEVQEDDIQKEAKGKRKLRTDAVRGSPRVRKKVKRETQSKVDVQSSEVKDDISCTVCGEMFQEEYMLLEHEVAKHWTCTFCQVQFAHEESFDEHQKVCKGMRSTRGRSKQLETKKIEQISHANLKPYKKEEKFLRFVSVHQANGKAKKKMVCTVCDAKYETMTQLKKHIQGIHTREKDHICDDCGQGFTEESKLIYHKTNTCNTKSTQDEKDEEEENPSLPLEGENSELETSELETSKMDDNTEVVFNITFDRETGHADPSSAEEATEDSLADGKMCSQCNMIFTYEFQRRQHMSLHHWGCTVCCVQFLHEQPYESHIKDCKRTEDASKGPFLDMKLRRTYEGEDDFFKYIVVKFKEVDKKKQVKMECLICGKEYFGQLAKMMRHVKSVHTKECDYMCDTCSKPFADKDNLLKHVKKCAGKPWVPKKHQSDVDIIPTVIESAPEDEEITYACTICMETFTEDYTFREHMSVTHWGCGTCLWQFLDDCTFQEHASTCEDFKRPEEVDMVLPETDLIQFKDDRLFYQHVKMRVLKSAKSGKTRTFECGHEHCESSEHDHQTLSSLRKHIMYRHETKELKYQCKKCGIGFVDKFSLWKHNNKCTEGKEKIVISKLLSRIKPASGDGTKEDAVVVKKECPECEEAFLYDHNFREHMAHKHWVCKPCRVQYLSAVTFDQHKENCGKQFIGVSVNVPKVHLNLYRTDKKFFDFAQINFSRRSNRLYQCIECGDHNHGNLVKLKRHITSKHTKELTEKCAVCDKGFRDKRALLKHCYDHLKTNEAVLDVSEHELDVHVAAIEEYVQKYSDAPVSSSQKTCLRTLHCEAGCNITFADPIAHLTHLAEIHYRCQFCKMPFRSKTYQITHESVCGQNPDSTIQTSVGEEVVTSMKPLNHRRRESLDFMTEHGISYEDGRLNCYGCRRCDKAFKDIAKIKRHVLGHHLKVSEHVCNTCGKGFYEKKALISHEKVHKQQGERGYISCEICGLKLLADVPNSLKNHMTKHTGERPFLCHLCPMSFRAKNTLQNHINGVHLMKKDFVCSLCSFSCTTKGRLRIHMRIHTGEKPYTCDTCGESFREKGTLRNHKMIHSGYRTVSCDLCGQGFIKKVHYTSHMLNAHSIRVAESDPKVQSFIPQPIQIQGADIGGTTYQIVSNVEDEVEVVTDMNDAAPSAEYETVRIISGDPVTTEHAYIVMISDENDVEYTYAQ